jgi:hypothetical protein
MRDMLHSRTTDTQEVRLHDNSYRYCYPSAAFVASTTTAGLAVFSPLKRALAEEIETVTHLNSGRISRVDWTAAYIRARERAITARNMLIGF